MMNAKEIVATVVLCAVGCLLLSAIGLLAGWTETVGEAATDWLSLSVTTSAVVIVWTWMDKRKKNDNKNNRK